MSSLNTCRTCKHWTATKDKRTGGLVMTEQGVAQGECHRNPPIVAYVPMPQGLTIRTQFPLPHAEMYCGEYLPEVSVQQ
jgi:hypothetical protein